MPKRSSTRSGRVEILIGRALAAATHPAAAWKSSIRTFRVLLLASYFIVGYVSAFAILALVG